MAETVLKHGYRVVVGLGETGMSCARYLQSHHWPFCVVDTRDMPPQLDAFKQSFPDIDVETGSFSVELVQNASEIILSPGLSKRDFVSSVDLDEQIAVIGDIELFYREAKAPIVAITGSNAKSTVTTLIGEMVTASGKQVAVAGNIGKPALDALSDDVDVYVLELSSFQLELVQDFRAEVAVFLNVCEDHLDRYASMQDYVKTKQRIFASCGTAVCNLQDKQTWPEHASRQLAFSMQAPRDSEEFGLLCEGDELFLAHGAEKIMPVSEIFAQGAHHYQNCLAACAAVSALNINVAVMRRVLQSFKGLPHRCEQVQSIDGVDFINDSKGTNVGATLAAIEGLAAGKNIVLIAGGEGKGADFSLLAAAAKQYVKAAILIGRDAPLLEDVIGEVCYTTHAMDMKSAVNTAAQLAESGDVVLLSPACASFDMFANYEQRGESFRSEVRGLLQ